MLSAPVAPEPVPLSSAQAEVLECGLLTTGFNCVLQLPTGGGKTWLAEHAIETVLAGGGRAVYLAPLRALAEELLPRWRRRFDGHTVGVFTGDYHSGSYPVPFRDARLLIMTPERLDACTRAWRSHWGWIPRLDLVVVDEMHLLGEGRRGARLEGALSRIRRLNPFLRVLGLSATLGNRLELARWLDGVEYASRERPVPLSWRVVRYKNAADKPALLEAELRRGIAGGGQSLVFVQSRRRAESLSERLRAAGLPALHHHAGLGRAERRAVEERFRRRETPILVATATLEMGLNLPVRQVVLYDLQEWDGADFAPLSTNTVWQRVGRAGRRGLDAAGEAVLLAPQWDREAGRYEEGRFEPIRSGLSDERMLAEQILAEVAAGLARRPAQVASVMARSLAAAQGTLPDVRAVIGRMCEAGMLVERAEEDGEDGDRPPRRSLKATRLGRVATRHLLAPSTLVTLRRVLEAEPGATYLDLLAALCATGDCEPLLPADYEELEDLSAQLAAEPARLLARGRAPVTELLGVSGRRLLAALKTALAARAWTRDGDTARVAERFGAYPFEIERLAESLDRLLLAVSSLWEAGEGEEGTEAAPDAPDASLRARLGALRVMVRAGFDEAAATLTLVPGIGPELARRLARAGVGDIEALAQADPAQVAASVRGVRAGRAARWVEAAEKLVAGGASAFGFRDAEGAGRADGPVTGAGWTAAGVDPYRLRRALDLRVTGAEGGVFRVAGGTEPHLVQITPGGGYACDCVDAAKGTALCKHVLAVRLWRGDDGLRELAARLRSEPDRRAEGPLDLFALWMEGHARAWGGGA